MKKREFLAVGGAVPLMLAGCGGDGSGSAPVRLVNASVGYPLLGFLVETTQATTADVGYGGVSPFESVQAGTVTTAITVTTSGTVASVSTSTRTLSKDQHYSLVAYGFLNELKSVLITESTTAPDTGKANVNVLNTSVDIGSVDVYISPGVDLSVATQIAASVGSTSGIGQSIFSSVAPGSYFITVVGAGSISRGQSDVRFQSPTAVSFVDQQIATIILTPGASGTLANAIILTQGDPGAVVSFTNSTARVRAVTAVPAGPVVAVAGVLQPTNRPNSSEYFVLLSATPPAVTIDGAPVPVTGTLAPGGDYTLMVYYTNGVATTQLLLDDNTAPVGATGVKFRLINLATTDQLSMSVNSVLAASNVGFATASPYKELSEPQTQTSIVQLLNGATAIKTLAPQVLQAGRIFTEIVVDVTTDPVQDFFLASVDN